MRSHSVAGRSTTVGEGTSGPGPLSRCQRSFVLVLFVLVFVRIVRILAEVEWLSFVLDRVHAFFDLIGSRCARDEAFLLLVLREHLDLAGQQALLRIRAELDLALAAHRKARLAGEPRVLVDLSNDELHGAAIAGRDPCLVAVPTPHELDQTARELRLEQTQPNPARGLDDDSIAVGAQLGNVAGSDLGADVRAAALERRDDGL